MYVKDFPDASRKRVTFGPDLCRSGVPALVRSEPRQDHDHRPLVLCDMFFNAEAFPPSLAELPLSESKGVLENINSAAGVLIHEVYHMLKPYQCKLSLFRVWTTFNLCCRTLAGSRDPVDPAPLFPDAGCRLTITGRPRRTLQYQTEGIVGSANSIRSTSTSAVGHET